MRIIIAKYKSWLATAALAAVLIAFFANVALAAPITKAEPAVTQQQAPQRGTLSIIAILIGLVEREVAIYVPNSYQHGAAVPMLFALHGGGGNASKMYAPDKRIVEYAESQGFIAVFPNGLPSPDAPAGSDKFYWEDPANIGFMNHLIDLIRPYRHFSSRPRAAAQMARMESHGRHLGLLRACADALKPQRATTNHIFGNDGLPLGHFGLSTAISH